LEWRSSYVDAMDSATGKRPLKPLLILLAGALCISFAPVFVKLVGEARLGPTAIGFWRTLFGGLALMAIAGFHRQHMTLSSRAMGFAVLAGFIFFLDLFVWHRSIFYCGAGMSTILGNTQVFGTALLSYLIFKERLTVRYLASALSAIVGVVLLVGLISEEVVFTARYMQGIALGLATGVFYASYLITLKGASQRDFTTDVVVFFAWTSLAAAFFLGIAALIEPGPVLPPDWESAGLLFSLGFVAQALGGWAITASLAKIVASRAGLILLLQPTLAMVWGILFFAEQFTFSQLVGAVVTLAAIYYGGLRQR
jgi:drug/metabolite transporter (DMT)-like permease